MKNFTTRIKTCLLALLLAVVCVLPLGTFRQTKASAFSFNRGNASNTIYYYSDSEAFLQASELTAEYPGYNVVYDIDTMFTEEDATMLWNNLTTNGDVSFGENCIVMLQFMEILLDGELLLDLCALIDAQGAEIVFVSGFPESDYSDTGFVSYVHSGYFLSRFQKFVIDLLMDIDDIEDGDWTDVRIYLDDYFLRLSSTDVSVELEQYENYEAYFNAMILPRMSPGCFLEYFFDEMSDYLEVEMPQETAYEDEESYEAACCYNIAWAMKEEGIELLVQCGNYNFYDLIQGRSIDFTAYDEENHPIYDEENNLVLDEEKVFSETIEWYDFTKPTYGIVAAPIDRIMYNVFSALDSEERISRIYAWMMSDNISFEGDLPVVTDEMLREMYRPFETPDSLLLIEILDEIIE